MTPLQTSGRRPLLSVWRGVTRPSLVSRKAALTAAACTLLAAAVGCGGGEGVAGDATVTVYVSTPLCAGARQQLAREGGRAGSVHVRAVCLPNAREGGRLSLATIGANARRATEDSTTVGFLEAPDPATSRFSRPILESVGIAWISRSSGSSAMARLLRAIQEAGSGSLRESVREALRETKRVG